MNIKHHLSHYKYKKFIFLDKHNVVPCVQVMFVWYTLGNQRVEEKGAGTKKC